jgi:uncharacterized protein YndB with AHSA1/START domain
LRWVIIVVGALLAVIIAVFAVGATLPRKHTAALSIKLHQSPQVVWSAVSNHANDTAWRPELKAIKQLPDRNGHAVWQETDKHGNTLELEDTVIEPPKKLVREVHDTGNIFSGRWEIDITPTDNSGSMVHITEYGEVPNPLFRFMSRFVFGHTKSIEDYLGALAARFGEQAEFIK